MAEVSEHGTFIDDEGLELLLKRDVPCVPALYFEQASIERGPEFGLSQRVIDGNKETLSFIGSPDTVVARDMATPARRKIPTPSCNRAPMKVSSNHKQALKRARLAGSPTACIGIVVTEHSPISR